jgi:hypothetical protein|tara:strand:- start:452 stop:844 length:393 start_codon:yes stop_codon:yes gene_type:complete
MDFETTPKATLFFFFFYSSFILLLFAARVDEGESRKSLFERFILKADKSRLTQTKCFLSPSLRRRKRGGETDAREREDSLSLFVLAPFLTRAREFRRVSRARRDDAQRQQRCASAFYTKIFCRRDREIPK